MIKAYLGLGSNMGEKKAYIDEAIRKINQHSQIEIQKVSSYYETEPVGYTEQDMFLNVVAEIKTRLSPYDLLVYCNEIEADLHRKRLIRWGPRTIDIDILLYGDYQQQDEKLIIPHPRMTERAFVMIPLLEIAKDISIKGKAIEEIVKELPQDGIRKIK